MSRVLILLLVCAALAVPSIASADITTDCGSALDQPTCERAQAIFELLRDGTAVVTLAPDSIVGLDATGSPGRNTVQLDSTGTPGHNTVQLDAVDRGQFDERANALHGDIWVLVGLTLGGVFIGMFTRALFFERNA